MTKPWQIFTARSAFFFTLLLVAVALAFLAPKAVVNVDEQLHYQHAKKVVNWYFTGGQDTSSLHTPQTNLKYYGQSVDNMTALFNRIFNVDNEFLVRHYTGALFFLILLLFTGLMAIRVSNSWLVATFTVLALVFMPRLAGQAFGNLKDIPFAAGYMAGLFMIVQLLKEMPRPGWQTCVLLGLAIAFTVSVRAGGLILFAYLGISLILYFSYRPSHLKQIFSDKLLFVRIMIQGVVVVVIGYFAGLLFWPFALQNIFLNPLESLGVMQHYKISIRQIFEGELIWSTRLPWYYLPRWLLISTPGFILAGSLLFISLFLTETIKNKRFSSQQFLESFIFFAFAFPVIYVIVIGSNLYSGVRQMLFIFPPLTILSAVGVYRILTMIAAAKQKNLIYPFSFLFIVLLLWPLKHQIETFPVDYVYFNALAGGNQKAWGNYEYDYYFHALRKPAEYLIDIAGDKNVTVAMNCNLSNYFDDHPNFTYQYTRFMERSSYDWDYGLFGINYIHPHLLKNDLWQPAGILKTFYHKGNPVAVLVARTDKSDFFGISEIKNLNLQEGITLLKSALKNDPNNVWLYAHLAKAKLDAGDTEGFYRYVQQGKEIHPYFEPFFLLEASRLFDMGKYRESFGKLKQLFEINPRYQPADELYKVLKGRID